MSTPQGEALRKPKVGRQGIRFSWPHEPAFSAYPHRGRIPVGPRKRRSATRKIKGPTAREVGAKSGEASEVRRAQMNGDTATLQGDTPELAIPIVKTMNGWDVVIQVTQGRIELPDRRWRRGSTELSHRAGAQHVTNQQKKEPPQPVEHARGRAAGGVGSGVGIAHELEFSRRAPFRKSQGARSVRRTEWARDWKSREHAEKKMAGEAIGHLVWDASASRLSLIGLPKDTPGRWGCKGRTFDDGYLPRKGAKISKGKSGDKLPRAKKCE